MLGVYRRYIYTKHGAGRVDLIDQVAVCRGWYGRSQELSGWGVYREVVGEQKITADVSATSITTRCLAGEKSPPLSLQGHQAQTGDVRGHPGEEVQGLSPPSGSQSCGLVVLSPLWRVVPQRVEQQTPWLSLTITTWSCTVGGGLQARKIWPRLIFDFLFLWRMFWIFSYNSVTFLLISLETNYKSRFKYFWLKSMKIV